VPYYIYDAKVIGNSTHLRWHGEETSLAGCNNGCIVRELRKIIRSEINPPIGWTLPISEIYRKSNQAFVIDLNPNGKESNLAELESVFGFSYLGDPGWSPVLLKLNGLTNGWSKDDFDEDDFEYITAQAEVMYTFLYLRGSFFNGEITGTWNFPAPSSTNSLLLYPEAMSFLFEMVKTHSPDFLSQKFQIL
jgi:hypothetical protein